MFSSSAGHMNKRDLAYAISLHMRCYPVLAYQLLGSQVWIVLSMENSRLPATAIDREVGKQITP